MKLAPTNGGYKYYGQLNKRKGVPQERAQRISSSPGMLQPASPAVFNVNRHKLGRSVGIFASTTLSNPIGHENIREVCFHSDLSSCAAFSPRLSLKFLKIVKNDLYVSLSLKLDVVLKFISQVLVC